MKLAVMSLAMVAAVAAAAAPATAQTVSYFSNAYNAIRDREDRLSERTDQALSDGNITMTQARSMKVDLNRLVRLDRNYRYDGLTPSERDNLVSRLYTLESNLRYDISQNATDNEDYGYGYYR